MSDWRGSDNQLRLVWRLPLFAAIVAACLIPLISVRPQWLQLLLGVMIFTAILYLWARFVERRGMVHFGLELSPRLFGELALGLAIGVCAIGSIFGSLLLWSDFDAISSNPAALGSAFALFAFRMLLVGYWEELLFRGFLFRQLSGGGPGPAQANLRTACAVLVTSLLFGLAHSWTANFSLAAFLLLSLIGAAFAVPMLMTGRLGLSIGLHTAWNFSQTFLFGFPMSGNAPNLSLFVIAHDAPEVWTGGDYGPEAGLSSLLAITMMTVLVWLACRFWPEPKSAKQE